MAATYRASAPIRRGGRVLRTHSVLEDRGINPEELPPEQDLKKLERRMKIQFSPDLEYPYCRKYPW